MTEEEFKPYKTYLKNISQINEFEELTYISYGLSQQLLFKHAKEELPKFEIEDEKEFLKTSSYCMADVKIKNTSLSCKWISVDQYAEKQDLSKDKVLKLLNKKELGTTQIDPETGEHLIIWPQSYKDKSKSELPKPGKSSFKVTLEINASASIEENVEDMTNFENIQKRFLYLAHSIGKPEEVNENATNTLYRSCFLLHWTSFEVYLRSVLDEVIIKNPEILFDDKQAEKLSLSFKELYSFSNQLKSIIDLKSRLIENEIAKQEGDGKSIHGIINFLKTKLNFEKDPYIAWYKLNGEHKETNYQDLIELKDVRNSLIHDAGFPKSNLFQEYSSVKEKSGEIIIDKEYFTRAQLLLKSIAYNLASLIVEGNYKIKTANQT